MPSITPAYEASCGSVKHVNLMLDTFIANAPVADLRAVIRTLLTTDPATTSTFSAIVRTRLIQLHANITLPSHLPMFTVREGVASPTHQFSEVLGHARMLLGAGLGVESLPSYTHIIRSTFPLHWGTSDDDPLLPHLAIVDADLAQAIQSCKEEVAAGHLQSEEEVSRARATLGELNGALEESKRLVKTWGGEFCFDRGYFATEDWRNIL